jgi:Fur family transcriptional regulator, ferric uptake regulator
MPTQSDIETSIRAHGARVTGARVAVLAALHASASALTHLEMEKALEGTVVDRVTIYRVLDWLVEVGLAHKVADGGRAVRFSVGGHAGGAHSHAHAHFKCGVCEGVFCLDDVRPPQLKLPEGFSRESLDLTVHGTCANCGVQAA